MNDRERIKILRAQVAAEVEQLQVTPERIEAAYAVLERIKAEHPQHEQSLAFQCYLLEHPEWIGVYSSITIDVIDSRLSTKQ